MTNIIENEQTQTDHVNHHENARYQKVWWNKRMEWEKQQFQKMQKSILRNNG